MLRIEPIEYKIIAEKFYQQQRYHASFMGNDNCFVAKLNNDIVGAVIVSTINQHHLLHALVVRPAQRRQGIASQLAKQCISNNTPLYCFADKSLKSFYLRLSFKQLEICQLPHALAKRYSSYSKKNKSLLAFVAS